MATLNNGSSMTGDITLTKKSGTILTLSTDDKYVDKDIQFTLGVQSAALSGASGSADADVESTDSSSVGGVNISGVIRDKTTTEPSSGYYIRVKATGSVTPNVSTAGWLDAGELPSASATATKFFPVTGATVTQNAPTVNSSTGVVTATTTTTAGYTPEKSTAASNTLQLSTQAAKTVSPTESEQTAVAAGKYTTGIVKVGAISSSYVGSAITRNDSDALTAEGATVTAPAGYYATDATKTIASGSAKTPATTVTANPTISVSEGGLITASASASKSVTPTVTAGYVSSGTAGTITVSGSNTSQLSTQAAATISPTESEQTAVAKGKFTTGIVKVGAIPSDYVGSAIDQNDSDDLTVSGATVTAPAGYYAEDASASVASGAISASVSSNTGGSASMSASGFTAASGTTGYYVNLATTAGSVKAKATVGTEGYVTSSDTTETAATSVAVSGNGNKLYIPTTGVTASVSSNTGGSASMAATGFTPLSSGTSSYYVTLSTSAGSVKAKAVGNGTGMISSSTSNETGATSVAVSGNGNKVYIPATGVTASVSSNTGGSASMAATGMTPLSSGTSSYYVTLSTSAGSVKAKAVGNGTGMVTSSTSNETGATSVAVSGNGTKMYIPEATFANTATSGTTYTDKSSKAPVLIAGDYLYINKGYTPDIKISLAKLVPDGSDVKGHGEYIISGHSAYDNDGTLVAGTIPTLVASDITVSGGTVTIPLGKYTGASDGTAVSTNVGSGAVTTSFTGDGMSTYFNSGTSSDKNVTITPKYTNTAGYVAAHSTATNNGGTAYYKIKTVSGSIGGSASGGSATAAISNVNSMATITDISGKTAGTDYYEVKATATGTAGRYTPKYTVSTAGWIGSTVTGTAQSVSVSSDTTGQSIYVQKGTYTATVTSASCNTKPTFTPSTSGTITDISSETAPTSGTDGTDYWTITPDGSSTNGNARSKSTATISASGYIEAGSVVSGYKNVSIVPTVNAGTARYIPKAVIAGSSTNATATTTVAPGAVSISKQSTPSGVTNAASGNATTTAPSSGVYVAVKATAAANTTGTTSSISGSGTATVTGAGYAPTTLTGTVSVSGTATAKTSAKDSSMTYVPITTATPAFDGGGLSGTATASSSQATLSDSTNTSGIAITTACTATRADVLYNGAVAGWVSKADNAVALSSGSSAMTAKTYYVNAVTVPSSKTFAVTNNGTATVSSGSATAGNLTVSAYNSSGTAENNKSIVSAGKWVATSVSASGTYYGRVTVGAGAYSASVPSHSVTTTPVVTGSISGTVTDIGTTTQPSGTDGTDYWTITPGGSVTTTGVSTAKGKATIGTAGYLATGNTESSASTVNITPSVSNGKARYIAKGAITNNTSGGTSTATINRGKQIKIGAGYYPSDLYYTAQNNSGTLTITTSHSSSTNVSCNGKSNVKVTGITVKKDGAFTLISTADTALDTTSDITITNNAYRQVRVTNNANGNTAVTNSGTASVASGSATAGTLTVSAYNASGTAENNKSIVSNGKWVATTPTAYGTYYGRVTISASSILKAHYTVNSLYATTSSTDNPATTLGFGTWTKIAPTSLKWNDLKGTTWSSGTTGISNGVYVWKRTA